MENLLKSWGKIEGHLGKKYVYLFLDFDGTLTPIRRSPDSVRLSGAAREALRHLASREDVFLAIVSGRRAGEVKELTGLKDIVYVGNHGFEVTGPGPRVTFPGALKAKKTMGRIRGELEKSFRSFKGIIIEDKGVTVSVHYRMVRKGKLAEAEHIFERISRPYVSAGKIAVTRGKKVWELRPPFEWNKGTTVMRLLEQKRRLLEKRVIPFYIGDDRTDEDAFRALGRGAYTVRVGKPERKSTLAAYYLRNTTEVREFLKKLYAFKERG